MKKLLALILAVIMIAGLSACGGKPDGGKPEESSTKAAGGDDKVYSFVMGIPEVETTYRGKIDEWAAGLKDKSNGRIDISIQYGSVLGAPPEVLGLVETGGLDMTWFSTGHAGGRFTYAEVLNIPYIGVENGMQVTKVAQELYKEFTCFSDELKTVHVLTVHANAATPISSNKKVAVPADFKGLQIRSSITPQIMWLQNMGAAPVSFAITDSFENLSKNVCDAVCNDWNAINAFKIYELNPCYMLDINLGCPISFIIMNSDRWDQLPDDLKALFDETYEELGFAVAECFSLSTLENKQLSVDHGVEIVEVNDELLAAMEAANEATAKQWIEKNTTADIDAQAYYDRAVELLAEYAGDYAEWNP
ncbi:MAG: TRAP transporter substrate-binding protein [Lachnospiraceae bacterium]|jgi:TRAP-type C4-dicarboxylate transport system substrate-binding protein